MVAVLLFKNKQSCEAALDRIDANNKAIAARAGYTIKDGVIVGKNPNTGEDVPDAVGTERWDIPHELPDGSGQWWIADPSARYGEDAITGIGQATEADLPPEQLYPPDIEG